MRVIENLQGVINYSLSIGEARRSDGKTVVKPSVKQLEPYVALIYKLEAQLRINCI